MTCAQIREKSEKKNKKLVNYLKRKRLFIYSYYNYYSSIVLLLYYSIVILYYYSIVMFYYYCNTI